MQETMGPIRGKTKKGTRHPESDHRGRKGRRTKEMVTIARERMDLLMAQAVKASRDGDGVKANRYANLARDIGMRYNIRMRPEHRLMICRQCNCLLIPSRTSSVRIVRGRRITHCLKCGDIRRTPIGPKRDSSAGNLRSGRELDEEIDLNEPEIKED